MPHDVQKLLVDIRTACEEIIQFTEGKNIDDFKKDRILQLALERQFEIIGEAIFRLDRIDHENLTIKIPEYPKIIGFRNVIAHGYDIIDYDVLWDFAKERVQELLEKAHNY
ncbi:MAG: HepT-like ribonuclease domain-containing protein [Balneolales bacterium]